MPRVSVITPIYNSHPYLSAAVESVFEQTYSDWELFLVDDGSRDGSDEMARAYAQRDPDRVLYLEHAGHKNRGVSATRNLAVRHARGEYLALLDADDVWLPEKLQLQVTAAERHPDVAVLYGLAPRIDAEGRLVPCPPEGDGDPYLPARYFERLTQVNFIPASTTLVRRACLRGARPFEERLRFQSEDWLLWCRLASRRPFLFLPVPLAHYRLYQASATQRVPVRDWGESHVEWLRFLFRGELRGSPYRRTVRRYWARRMLPWASELAHRGHTYPALRLLASCAAFDPAVVARRGFHMGWVQTLFGRRAAAWVQRLRTGRA